MSPAEKQRRRQHRKERKLQRDLRRDRERFGSVVLTGIDSPDYRRRTAGRDVRVLSYDITSDALPQPRRSLDGLLTLDKHEQLFHLTAEDPAAAIPKIEELLERAPDAPVLLNWLGRAHSLLGHDEKVDELALRNFQRNPDYLFARINYAQRALSRGELEQIPLILDKKYDLKLLYPERSVFHVSEYLAFASLMGEFYVRTGEQEAAERTLETMEKIDPDHEVTCRLRDVVETSGLLQVFRRVLGMKRRKRLGQ